MDIDPEVLVRVIAVAMGAICNFILLCRKVPARFSYSITIIGINIVFFLGDIVILGYMDPWAPLVHFFMTIFLIIGSVVGQIVWVLYSLTTGKNVTTLNDD